MDVVKLITFLYVAGSLQPAPQCHSTVAAGSVAADAAVGFPADVLAATEGRQLIRPVVLAKFVARLNGRCTRELGVLSSLDLMQSAAGSNMMCPCAVEALLLTNCN
jgi:hypothetical protein